MKDKKSIREISVTIHPKLTLMMKEYCKITNKPMVYHVRDAVIKRLLKQVTPVARQKGRIKRSKIKFPEQLGKDIAIRANMEGISMDKLVRSCIEDMLKEACLCEVNGRRYWRRD